MIARRFIKIAAFSAIGLAAASCGAVAAIPALRYFALALANDPRSLSAVETDARVHFEPGARECALEVAARLSNAVALVETAQGRPFARDVPIGVYASTGAYAQANGLGTSRVAGVAFPGRLTLSPALCGAQRERMTAVLTHELSHAHLQGWMTPLAFAHVPNWFKEGLAVMVSGGGGAEGVSEAEAVSAILAGDAIAVQDEGSLLNLTAVRFETNLPRNPARDANPASRAHLAYRQAEMFVAWLRERNPKGFMDFLQSVENGEPFPVAFQARFASRPSEQWRTFAAQLEKHDGDRAP
jgi:hypothetical protein